MPEANEDQINDLVVQLVEAVTSYTGRSFERFEVFFMHTGQYPYRTHLLDETYPFIGLAQGEPLSDLKTEIATDVTDGQWGGEG